MIYGNLLSDNWKVARLEGEPAESFFETSDLRLFFWGTIYNRDLLHADIDDSNAKISANLYLKEGFSGFYQLDGAFTLVFFTDSVCGVVRDHHGTHYPVYYTANGNFSTSVSFLAKHLYAHSLLSDDSSLIDRTSLSSFLQSGLLPATRSAYSQISRLEAGRAVIFEKSRSIPADKLMSKDSTDLSVNCYVTNIFAADYALQPIKEKGPDVDAYSRRYGELHVAAIQRRIGNSNNVGILLSGGYDSGANLAALRSVYDGEIDSFSVGFKGDTWTELPLARLMSKTFGTRHHEYEIDGSEITALPAIVDFLGEPFVEGGLMVNYCAMRMVGDHKPDVILGGDGSDQYFGTTGREVALHYLAARNGMLPAMKAFYALLNRDTFDRDGKLYRIRFHLDKALHILEGDRFGFPDFRVREFVHHPTSDFLQEHIQRADTRSFEHLYAQHALLADLDTTINRVILYKASRMAKMFGNNLTFPYMDLALYHFLQDLPVSLKCKADHVLDIARGRSIAKYLLKYHYKPMLPTEITSKRKQGGFAPMPLFFRNEMQRARLKDFILSSSITKDYLRRDCVERFLTDYDHETFHEGGWFWYRQNRALQYFNLLTLTVWWERFVGQKEANLS